jgi:PPOX class probable F420-dependent enzyme
MGVKRRAEVAMSETEIAAFLREGSNPLAMASISPDGRVHLVAMWYGFAGPLVGVQTKRKSQKVQNLRRDPRVTVLVESGDTTATLKGVEIVGVAEIIDDACDEWRELAASVLHRYVLTGTPVEELARPEVLEAAMHNRVAILVHPEKIVSWDHTKIPNGGY